MAFLVQTPLQNDAFWILFGSFLEVSFDVFFDVFSGVVFWVFLVTFWLHFGPSWAPKCTLISHLWGQRPPGEHGWGHMAPKWYPKGPKWSPGGAKMKPKRSKIRFSRHCQDPHWRTPSTSEKKRHGGGLRGCAVRFSNVRAGAHRDTIYSTF